MENKNCVRIESIKIENFKNVQYGYIDFENKRKDYRASILGLYGQNGSGKTALIDAFQVLKFVLCGQPVPVKYADYVNVEEACSVLEFQFRIKREEQIYNVWYQFL